MKTSNLFVRVLAAIIDTLLVCFPWFYFIEMWGHAAIGDSLTSAAPVGNKVVTGTPAAVLLLVTALYWIIPEWILGATPGKLVLGLRVKTLDDDQPISFGQSCKRNLLRLIDFFPFYLTGFLAAKFTPNHQRLGDLWAKTVVVNGRSGQDL